MGLIGGGDVFESKQTPYNADQLDMILNGAYITDSLDLRTGVYSSSVPWGQNDDIALFTGALAGKQYYHVGHSVADLVTQVGNTQVEHKTVLGAHIDEHTTAELGALRAYVRGYATQFDKKLTGDLIGNTLVKGPWYGAVQKLGTSLSSALLTNMTAGAAAFTPAAIPSGNAFNFTTLKAALNVDSGGAATTLSGSLLDLLNAKTITYISGVETFDDFMKLFSAPVGDNGFLKVYDAIFGTAYDIGSMPSTTITAAPTFTQADAVPSAPTVASPTLVTVTDALTAAKAAMWEELQTKYNNNVAEIRASIFGSRGMRPTNFDDVIAEKQDDRDKAYRAYLAQLDLEQSKMNADYADKHEDRLQAHDMAEGDFVLKTHGLKQSRDAQLLQYVDFKIRQNIEQADLIVKAALDWEQAKSANAGIRVDVVKALYDAVAGWMHAKGMILSNSGPVAATIGSALDAEMADSKFTREYYLKAESERYQLISAAASSFAGQAELEWKSMQQNIEHLRNVMSVFGVSQGQAQNKSPFDNANAGLGTVAGIASAVVGIASVL